MPLLNFTLSSSSIPHIIKFYKFYIIIIIKFHVVIITIIKFSHCHCHHHQISYQSIPHHHRQFHVVIINFTLSSSIPSSSSLRHHNFQYHLTFITISHDPSSSFSSSSNSVLANDLEMTFKWPNHMMILLWNMSCDHIRNDLRSFQKS